VVVVTRSVAESFDMDCNNDVDNTDKLVNAYGLDFNQVLNQESKTVWHGATKVEEGVYAMVVPADLPWYLPRYIGQGMRIDLQDCVDEYIVVHMHKVNLLSLPGDVSGLFSCVAWSLLSHTETYLSKRFAVSRLRR